VWTSSSSARSRSNKLVLVLVSRVVLRFGHHQDPWPNFCLFEDCLCVWKRTLLFFWVYNTFVAPKFSTSEAALTQRLYYMGSIHSLTYYYNEQFLCKMYTRCLSVQACATYYALAYFITPKWYKSLYSSWAWPLRSLSLLYCLWITFPCPVAPTFGFGWFWMTLFPA
jgi:hypothetical protein